MSKFNVVVAFEKSGIEQALGGGYLNGQERQEPRVMRAVYGLTEEQANAVVELAKFYQQNASCGFRVKVEQ